LREGPGPGSRTDSVRESDSRSGSGSGSGPRTGQRMGCARPVGTPHTHSTTSSDAFFFASHFAGYPSNKRRSMIPTPILLFGASGLLGCEVRARLERKNAVITAPSRQVCDLGSEEPLTRFILGSGAALVINCAAYNAVERADQEHDVMWRINAIAPQAMARSVPRLIHFSTDFVFDGSKRKAYVEEDDPAPLQAYGHAKLAGDRAVLAASARSLVVRTGCLFGRAGRGFSSTLIPRLRAGERIRADDERRIRPTWGGVLADHVLALAETEQSGLFHAMCKGETTWAGFARELARQAGFDAGLIEGVPTAALRSSVQRPANAMLENRALQRLGLDQMPKWEEALEAYLREELMG